MVDASQVMGRRTGANGPDPATVVLTAGFGRSAAPFDMTVSGIADWFAVSAIRKNPASPAMGTEEILDAIDRKMASRKTSEAANYAAVWRWPADIAPRKPNEWGSCSSAKL
jgi:hypothetical protein